MIQYRRRKSKIHEAIKRQHRNRKLNESYSYEEWDRLYIAYIDFDNYDYEEMMEEYFAEDPELKERYPKDSSRYWDLVSSICEDDVRVAKEEGDRSVKEFLRSKGVDFNSNDIETVAKGSPSENVLFCWNEDFLNGWMREKFLKNACVMLKQQGVSESDLIAFTHRVEQHIIDTPEDITELDDPERLEEILYAPDLDDLCEKLYEIDLTPLRKFGEKAFSDVFDLADQAMQIFAKSAGISIE